jgi:hypothetical protein
MQLSNCSLCDFMQVVLLTSHMPASRCYGRQQLPALLQQLAAAGLTTSKQCAPHRKQQPRTRPQAKLPASSAQRQARSRQMASWRWPLRLQMLQKTMARQQQMAALCRRQTGMQRSRPQRQHRRRRALLGLPSLLRQRCRQCLQPLMRVPKGRGSTCTGCRRWCSGWVMCCRGRYSLSLQPMRRSLRVRLPAVPRTCQQPAMSAAVHSRKQCVIASIQLTILQVAWRWTGQHLQQLRVRRRCAPLQTRCLACACAWPEIHVDATKCTSSYLPGTTHSGEHTRWFWLVSPESAGCVQGAKARKKAALTGLLHGLAALGVSRRRSAVPPAERSTQSWFRQVRSSKPATACMLHNRQPWSAC